MSLRNSSTGTKMRAGAITTVTALALGGLAAHVRPAAAQVRTPGVPVTSDVAIAKGRFVDVFDDATAAKARLRLDANQNFSRRLVFLVIDSSGPRLKVQLPVRPNGATGYVDRGGMTIKTRGYYIKVDLSEHKLTLYKEGVEMFTNPVATGTSATPTPIGKFYLAELAKVTTKNSDYGPWAFGVAAFSDKITRFKNRPGQIGLHGTNHPQDLGKEVSHGCIRIANATITKMASTVPQGTPIEVVA